MSSPSIIISMSRSNQRREEQAIVEVREMDQYGSEQQTYTHENSEVSLGDLEIIYSSQNDYFVGDGESTIKSKDNKVQILQINKMIQPVTHKKLISYQFSGIIFQPVGETEATKQRRLNYKSQFSAPLPVQQIEQIQENKEASEKSDKIIGQKRKPRFGYLNYHRSNTLKMNEVDLPRI